MNELLLQQTPRDIRVVDRLLFYFIFNLIIFVSVYHLYPGWVLLLLLFVLVPSIYYLAFAASLLSTQL
jgi:hypothetical protein